MNTLVRCAFAIALLGCDKPNEVTTVASATPSVAVSAPSASASASASSADPLGDLLDTKGTVIREEKDVIVDGVTEKWRLEWARPPVPDCVADNWSSCPCAGFAFGEKGDLDLVRVRAGSPDDRLRLDSLFEDQDSHLHRWPTSKADEGKKPDIASLVMRPVISVLKFADYDHDGRATEFVLQVGASACGHTPSVVVGISKSNAKLHAFTTKDKPTEPLFFDRPTDWDRLKNKPSIDVVQVACGDHGADHEADLAVSADGELHLKETSKACPSARP